MTKKIILLVFLTVAVVLIFVFLAKQPTKLIHQEKSKSGLNSGEEVEQKEQNEPLHDKPYQIPQENSHKLGPGLQKILAEEKLTGKEKLKLSIWVKSDDKINRVIEYLQSQGIKVIYKSTHAPIIFVEITLSQLNSLLSRDDVVSVDISYTGWPE